MEALVYCGKLQLNDHWLTFQDELLPISQAPTETVYETVDIRHETPPRLRAISGHLPATYLSHFIAEKPDSPSGEVVPHLKLICLRSSVRAKSEDGGPAGVSLNIGKTLFSHLLEKLRANPWVLWLMSNKYDGFHRVKATDQHLDTYFFGFFHSAIFWTFCPKTACTRVLLISRLNSDHSDFFSLLSTLTSHLFTPYVPLLAIALATMLDFDDRMDHYVGRIAEVEQGTGFSYIGMNLPASDLGFDIDALTTWSRVAAAMRINIINCLRHHENCMRALEMIERLHVDGTCPFPNISYSEDYIRAMGKILEPIQVLKMRADSFRSYGSYIKDRAEAQINVIFALLTHEDSVSNLKAAQAATEIAAATKKDSSAMKTIAAMTMAFLPATFLAAVFALPALEWERKMYVEVHGFQLYWIVSIPLTAAVFLVWAFITQRALVMEKVFGKSDENQTEKQDGDES